MPPFTKPFPDAKLTVEKSKPGCGHPYEVPVPLDVHPNNKQIPKKHSSLNTSRREKKR